MSILTGTASVFERDVRAKLRTPWPYVEAMADPLLLLVLFLPLVSAVGPMPGVPADDSLQWFVPGMLVMMVFTTSAFIGSGFQEERASGALERMLVTPVSRFALLAGRVLRVIVIALVQALIIVAVTVPFGLEVPALGAMVAAVQLAALAAGLGICSLATGLVLKNAYAFWGVIGIVYTPIIVTSGVLLPMEIAPAWLHALSRANPLAHVVDGQRALFAGDFVNLAVVLGLSISALLCVVGGVAGTRAMHKLRA